MVREITKDDLQYFIGMLVANNLITDKKVITYFGDDDFQEMMAIYNGDD